MARPLAPRRCAPALLGFSLLALTTARADDDLDLARLPDAVREEAGRITADPTVRCNVSARVRTTPDTYRWLLAHLDFSARALDALGLEGGRYEIVDGPAGITVDDRAGATAVCERALDEPGRLVVIARGKLEVPVLPSVLGTGVIAIRWAHAQDDPEVLEVVASVAFRANSRLLHALTAPLRKVLAGVLEEKLTLLLRSATALAEVSEQEPWRVVEALEAAKDPPAAADMAAFRRDILAR